MGLPVISTNWSGLTAFMTDDVAYPIRVEAVEPVHDQGRNAFEWFQGQRWARPSEEHLRQLMRHVYAHQEDAAAVGRAARERVVQRFSQHAVAKQLLAQLLRLQDEVDDMLSAPLSEGAGVVGGGRGQGRAASTGLSRRMSAISGSH